MWGDIIKNYPRYVLGVPFSEEQHLLDNISLRFLLEVKIRTNKDSVLCIMMNPSIANSYGSDDTVNKILDFLKKETLFGLLKVVNLYPVYKTQSNMLSIVLNEIERVLGAEKIHNIMKANKEKTFEQIVKVDNIILAWGDPPEGMPNDEYLSKANQVLEFLSYLPNKNVYIFDTDRWEEKLTKKGQPRHPGRNNLIGLLPCTIGKLNNSIYLI